MPLRIAVDVQNLPKEPKTEVAEKATNPKTESQATTTNNKRSIKTEVLEELAWDWLKVFLITMAVLQETTFKLIK